MTYPRFKTPRGVAQCANYQKKAVRLLDRAKYASIEQPHQHQLMKLFAKYIFAIERYKQRHHYSSSAKAQQLLEKRHYIDKLQRGNVMMTDLMPIKLKCNNCGDIISSKRGGEFVSCTCFKDNAGTGIYMDRDRWFPERYRIGGDKDNYEVIQDENI